MNCALKKTSEVLCNFIWLSAPPCLSLSPSLSLPLPISLSLSLSAQFSRWAQRWAAWTHLWPWQNPARCVHSHTSAVSLRGPIRASAVQSGIWPALTTSRGYFRVGTRVWDLRSAPLICTHDSQFARLKEWYLNLMSAGDLEGAL